MPRAGGYRHPITIRERSLSRGMGGEDEGSWGDLDDVWAAIEPLKGLEKWEAQRVVGEEVTRFKIRYRSDVLPNMRIKFGSEVYTIEEIINVGERDRELVLIARRLAD